VILYSYAKLNLYLEVLNKRTDNFHNLKTLFERISLSDKIILKSRPDNRIKITCNDKSVPCDDSNLIFIVAKLLQNKFSINKGLEVKIIKRIPVGAGLGGGSSNAAWALLGLNDLWKLNLSRKKLVKLAGEIGSDVAFFIYNTPFAIGRSRGEKILPLNKLKTRKLWHVLIVPKIHVSTPAIFTKFDSFSGLTKPIQDVNILTSELVKKGPPFSPGLLFNSLEFVTLRLYPEVKRIKETFKDLGLKNVLMSGSGPAVFAIVSSRVQALDLAKRVKKINKSWRVFVVSTI